MGMGWTGNNGEDQGVKVLLYTAVPLIKQRTERLHIGKTYLSNEPNNYEAVTTEK